jgi:large subunit ribosomal protein L17
MRHQKSLRKFGRSAAHRQAMFRNMATSLLREERIQTTVCKAKDLRRVVEKLITLAGNDTLHARRQAYGFLNSKPVVHKLFSEIGPRYKARPGGYTRVVRIGQRASDSAELAVIELVEEELPKKKKAKKSARAGSRAGAKKKAAPTASKEEAIEAAPAVEEVSEKEETPAEEAKPEAEEKKEE